MSESLVMQFKRAHESVSGRTHAVSGAAGVSSVLGKILAGAGARRVVLAGLAAELAEVVEACCAGMGIEILKAPFAGTDPAREIDQAQAGITGAAFAIAESGTVAEIAQDDVLRLASSLPETHVALVRERDIVATIADAAPRIDQAFAAARGACAVSLISGPSRSGDIGMQLTLGVHGPRAAHVIVVENE